MSSSRRCTNRRTDDGLGGVPSDSNSDVLGKCESNGRKRSTRHAKMSKSSPETDHVGEKENKKGLFPKHLHWILFLVTLVYRINYVLCPDNWWILHPDEVFQTIEVAHTEAYGYGFRSYEYLQPPPALYNNTRSVISAARAQEVSRGMYSLRSFMLPKLLSYVLLAADGVFDLSPFLVGKLLHVAITSLLPVAVYLFAATLHRSRDVATLSAIFVCSSPSLNVFGTHSLINSFVSPLHFYSLAIFVAIIQRVQQQHGEKHQQLQLVNGMTNPRSPDDNTMESNNNNKTNVKQTVLVNGHTQSMARNGCTNGSVIELKSKYVTKRRTVQRSVLAEDLRYLLSCVNLKELICGAILGFTIYVRIDLVLLPVLFGFSLRETILETPYTLLRELRQYIAGFVTVLLIGGYVDWETFGHWFVSPIQWFKFNVLSNSAESIFGTSPSSFYINNLVHNEPLMALLIVLLILDVGITFYKSYAKHQLHHITGILASANPSLFLFIVLLFMYSTSGHKEYRFLHNVIVLMYISFACAILRLYDQESSSASNQNKDNQRSLSYILYASICVLASSHIYYFHRIAGANVSDWTYGKDVLSREVNKGLDFIRHQNDVTGVFIDMSVHMTGGYSLLHRDVPILSLNKYEHVEYEKTLKIHGTSKSFVSRGVSSFGLISDFMSVHNTHYLLRHLIKKRQYNYLVMKVEQEFIDQGFEVVYQTGTIKILRRRLTNESETILNEMTNRIPLGTNATILEYEGDWLSHFGCYKKAEERLLFANRLNSSLLGPFQVLMKMFKHLNDEENYSQVYQACTQVHPPEVCNRKYSPVVLHPQYFRGG